VSRRTIEALVRAGAFDALDPDRARVFDYVATAMEAAEQRAAHAHQTSLFGAESSEPAAMVPPRPSASWSERRRLQEEKTALGFYFSGHLFKGYGAEVRRFVRTVLADLPKMVENGYGSVPVTVCGMVTSLSVGMTRRGKMIRVGLDDATASVELVIFNELYEQCRTLLKEDELLVIQGKVARDDYSGGVRLTAERVLDLGRARQEHARSVVLQLNADRDVARLRALLEPYRTGGAEGRAHDEEALGERGCPVEVRYANAVARCAVRLGDSWRIRPDEALLSGLRAWLSAEGVEVRYG